MKVFLTLLLIFNVSICSSQDFLVTKDKDTVYGNIEWKTNVFVYVNNKDGKQKFRADKVNFFQRGAFRFVSVKTNFSEFLLEVKKGEVSYYVESHLKSKYTIDYEKKIFLGYRDELYPINVASIEKYDDESNFEINPNVNIKSRSSTEFFSSNFKWSFQQILGNDNMLFKLIKKNNFTLDDIELLVELSNEILENPRKFEKEIDTTLNFGYAKGYVIPSLNDTIRGSIKMNGRFILSDKINFKTKKGEELSYNADELLEYKINDRVYKNDTIGKNDERLNQIIIGELSLYRDLKNSKSYLIKGKGEYVLVDKKKLFLELFKDKPTIYMRIIENNYEPFEIKSMVILYNEAPKDSF